MKTCGSFEWNKSDGICLNCGKPRADHQKPVRVIFRKWPKNAGGDVIALFPGVAFNSQPYECASYQTLGQHGAASVGIVNSTRKAKPAEYADLKKELERIGYKLTIAHKFTRADLIERSRQIAEHS